MFWYVTEEYNDRYVTKDWIDEDAKEAEVTLSYNQYEFYRKFVGQITSLLELFHFGRATNQMVTMIHNKGLKSVGLSFLCGRMCWEYH